MYKLLFLIFILIISPKPFVFREMDRSIDHVHTNFRVVFVNLTKYYLYFLHFPNIYLVFTSDVLFCTVFHLYAIF